MSGHDKHHSSKGYDKEHDLDLDKRGHHHGGNTQSSSKVGSANRTDYKSSETGKAVLVRGTVHKLSKSVGLDIRSVAPVPSDFESEGNAESDLDRRSGTDYAVTQPERNRGGNSTQDFSSEEEGDSVRQTAK